MSSLTHSLPSALPGALDVVDQVHLCLCSRRSGFLVFSVEYSSVYPLPRSASGSGSGRVIATYEVCHRCVRSGWPRGVLTQNTVLTHVLCSVLRNRHNTVFSRTLVTRGRFLGKSYGTWQRLAQMVNSKKMSIGATGRLGGLMLADLYQANVGKLLRHGHLSQQEPKRKCRQLNEPRLGGIRT